MRIDLPQCGFKNCRFCFDGNCTSKREYKRCHSRRSLTMLEHLIMDYKLCWLCQYENQKKNGGCDGRCTPIWNGLCLTAEKEDKL